MMMATAAGEVRLAGASAEPAARDERQEPEGDDARAGIAALVRVNLPLVSGSDGPLRLAILRLRDRLVEQARAGGDGRRPTLVVQIGAGDAAAEGGAGSAFEPALALARLLSGPELTDVKTVAWLPSSVRGHGVLAALACEEIVMAPAAEIGEAGADEPQRGGVSRTMVEAYREIAEAKRTVPAALALGWVDPAVEVSKVESEEGLRFLTRDELAEFRAEHDVISEEVLIPAGSLGLFTGREGRQFGFVKYLAGDRESLARALSVGVESLEADDRLGDAWHAVMLEVKGEVTPRTASEFKSLLTAQTAAGANWVGVRIDSVGGDLEACLAIAATLADLDPNLVRTVGYVPVEARGGAAVIALACDDLAPHPDATVGVGPDARPAAPAPRDMRRLPPLGAPPALEPLIGDNAADVAAAVAAVRDSLAPRADRSWSLLAAMIDPGVELLRYRNKASGAERLMSAEEVAARDDADAWVRGGAVAAANEPLKFTGQQAVEAGLAKRTVDSFDDLKRAYNLDDVAEVRSNWALALVQALASPGLAAFLLILGFIGLYIELKTPGVGIGGIVATLAFMLYFWSKYLDGTAEALEVIMFVGGLVLLLLEAFVVPGLGVFGLSGALLVIFSLILASQTFVIPHSQADMDNLRRSITSVVAAGIGVIAVAAGLRRFLPSAPLFNRMVLESPTPEERISLAHRETVADYSHLVGAVGEAVTDLAPTGKALVNDELVDVIVSGAPLDRGAAIEVVSAQANRVIVRGAT